MSEKYTRVGCALYEDFQQPEQLWYPHVFEQFKDWDDRTYEAVARVFADANEWAKRKAAYNKLVAAVKAEIHMSDGVSSPLRDALALAEPEPEPVTTEMLDEVQRDIHAVTKKLHELRMQHEGHTKGGD